MKDAWVLVAFVVVVAVLVALALSQPKVVMENDDYIWVDQSKTVVPGIAIGIPAHEVEFASVTVRRAQVTLKRPIDITTLVDTPRETILILTIQSKDAGFLMFALDKRLGEYIANIAESLGLGEGKPDQQAVRQKYIIWIFYAKGE